MLVSEKLIRITLKLIIGIAFITHKVIFKREKFIKMKNITYCIQYIKVTINVGYVALQWAIKDQSVIRNCY
jgi:hypothetical protein